jgi:hypothetical protein
MRMQPAGSVLLGLSIELFDQMMIGVSYGGDEIIGYGKPNFNPRVEFQAKYRVVDDLGAIPSVALGFDSQGYAGYFKESERYRIKSKGFYGVVGKGFPFMGRFYMQGGMNYSLETKDEDKEPDFFVGFDQTIGYELSVRSEYDFAFNDNAKDSVFGEGRGYLNAGVRWTYQERLFAEIDFCNINGNGKGPFAEVWRTIKLGYVEFL